MLSAGLLIVLLHRRLAPDWLQNPVALMVVLAALHFGEVLESDEAYQLPVRSDSPKSPATEFRVTPRRPALAEPGKRVAVFQPEFRQDLRWWVKTDRKAALRVLDLVEAVLRDPTGGIGKPEPLKYLGSDVWSRRVTQEHRLVYMIQGDRVDFVQARYLY